MCVCVFATKETSFSADFRFCSEAKEETQNSRENPGSDESSPRGHEASCRGFITIIANFAVLLCVWDGPQVTHRLRERAGASGLTTLGLEQESRRSFPSPPSCLNGYRTLYLILLSKRSPPRCL